MGYLNERKREGFYRLEFCPNCGSRLEPKKTGNDNAFVLCCAKCGHTKEPIDSKAEARTGKVLQPKPKPFMTIISEADQQITPMQTIKMKCEKCENNTVYGKYRQERRSSTQFMRCTNLGILSENT